MTSLRTLDDLDPLTLRGRRVLVRVDFNVPLQNGEVLDATRLEESLPTIRELMANGARVILISHCGRPKGQVNPLYSLRPVASRLEGLLGQPVLFAEDCVGDPARQAVEQITGGEICLLENLRYHNGETANDPEFADQLAELCDLFVSDAFGTAHRSHASVVGVAQRRPESYAGRLLVKEVQALGRLLDSPRQPFVGILGGAKIEGKIDTLLNLLPRLDRLLLGGGMANTFLAALGHDLKRSLVEHGRLDLAREILDLAESEGTRIYLPEDLVITDDIDSPKRVETVLASAIPEGTMAVDVGPATRKRFRELCSDAATLFWNGPLGVFEKSPFEAGTMAVAEGLGFCRGFTVIGGGETVAAVLRAGVEEKLSHISTGGGAALDLLAGKTLPGIAILEKTT